MSFRCAIKLFCRRQIFLPPLFAIALLSCSKPQPETRNLRELPNPILQERLEKDQFFKSDKESPLLEKDRATFRGLAYYPVDPALRFSVRLHRHPGPKRIRLATNTGEIRYGLRYGYFDFRAGDQACRLQVYRLEEESGNGALLFIPFHDLTSGKETYAAGRYIDLKENTSGVYDLDFNRAYNPYCAYNSTYSCPIPPAENRLTVPIRAGEKTYSR